MRCTWYTNADHVDIYPWEPFLSNFIFCTCIWTHKLWKDNIYNKKDAYLIENVSIAWSHEVHLGFPLNKMHSKCSHNLLVKFTINTGGIHGNWTCFTYHLPFNFSFLRNLCLFLSFLMPASERQTNKAYNTKGNGSYIFSAVSAHKRSKWGILYSIQPLDSSVCSSKQGEL